MSSETPSLDGDLRELRQGAAVWTCVACGQNKSYHERVPICAYCGQDNTERHQSVAAAESRIRTTVRALQADKARLDAIEREYVMVRPITGWNATDGDFSWQALRHPHGGQQWACGTTLREAIDRAVRSQEDSANG